MFSLTNSEEVVVQLNVNEVPETGEILPSEEELQVEEQATGDGTIIEQQANGAASITPLQTSDATSVVPISPAETAWHDSVHLSTTSTVPNQVIIDPSSSSMGETKPPTIYPSLSDSETLSAAYNLRDTIPEAQAQARLQQSRLPQQSREKTISHHLWRPAILAWDRGEQIRLKEKPGE